MAYSAVPTSTTGDLWTAANQNTYLRDNMTALAATRSKTDFIQASNGYNGTDGAALIETGDNGFIMTDAKVCKCNAKTYYPYDFSATMTVKPVVDPDGAGNLYHRIYIFLGADGEAYNTHDDGDGSTQTTAVTANQWNVLPSNTVSSIASGDFISLVFARDANDPTDTVNANVEFMGFLVEYTATNYG